MKTKVSKAQLAVLADMTDGQLLVAPSRGSGYIRSGSFHYNRRDYIAPSTIRALANAGLIEQHTADNYITFYRLTDAGKELTREEEVK